MGMKKSSWKANCALAIRMASFTAVFVLHHLVNGAVAVGREETLAELHRQLVDGVAFPVEVELLPNDGFLQHSSFSVVFHGAMYSFIYGFAKIHYFLERVPCGYKNLASCILHFIFFMLSGRVEKIVVIIVIINNITN